MAEKDKTEAPKASAPRDMVAEIGTLTYPRAVKAFGKDRAVGVMMKVAEIGGHGLFEASDFLSPLFGGLAMPGPEKIRKPELANFSHLPEAEFYYQAAVEEYEVLKAKAAADLVKINDLYLSLV